MQGVLDALVKRVLLCAHPVGCVYMSLDSTSPETLFGGTWTPINGRFLIGAGAPENNDDGTSPGSYDFAAGSTGGETTHTLTVSEIPSHVHSVNISSRETLNRVIWGDDYGSSDKNAWGFGYVDDTSSGLPTGASGVTAAYTGGNQPHNNMPPYLAVYMWRRTA